MFGFGKKKKNPLPPVELDERHTFATPQPGHYPGAQPIGVPTYATSLTREPFLDIPNQDRILTHWDRPPDGQSDKQWYDDRNADKIRRLHVENTTGKAWGTPQKRKLSDADPKWTPVPPSRVTNYSIPTNGYVYTRPYDQEVERHPRGIHSSMSDMLRTFSIGGMNPVHRGRNTYRVDPPTHDAQSVDLSSPVSGSPTPNIYMSPQVSLVSRSYRLGQ